MQQTSDYLSQQVHDCVRAIEERLLQGDKRRFVVDGQASAGKSSVLRQLRARLSKDNVCVIILAPPPRALDSGPCALLSFAGQLHDSFPPNGKPELDEFLKPQPLERRFAKLETWIANLSGKRLVVLSDEPDNWPGSGEHSADAAFSDQAQQFMRFLASLDCNHVLTGRVPQVFPRRDQQEFPLDLQGQNLPFLRDSRVWGELAESALELAEILGEDANSYSPLEIRLMVGLQKLAPMGLDESRARGNTQLRNFFDEFRRRILLASAFRPLWVAWSFISKCRIPIRTSFLSEIEKHAGLQGLPQTLLRSCLLYQEEGRWVLHHLLRNSDAPDDARIHGTLADIYRTVSENVQSQGEFLQAEAEAFYHAFRGGRKDIQENFRCYFVEQLNLWGKQLSRVEGDYAAAAQVFERSLQWDPEDPYANHYYAFNLDIQACHQDRIELHYRKALQLRPEHPWCHSRWVCYLLSVARNREAKEAWSQALRVSFSLPLQHLYRELHFWVLRMLLHRGQLDFVQELFDTMDVATVETLPELRVLRDQWEAQRLAQTHGAFVPSPVLKEGWWTRGPFRLARTLKEGHRLTQWMAARVEKISERAVVLRAAIIAPEQPSIPPVHHVELDRETLETWRLPEESLEVGAFLELGSYENDLGRTQHRAVTHRPDAHPLLTLPAMRPNPDRYASLNL